MDACCTVDNIFVLYIGVNPQQEATDCWGCSAVQPSIVQTYGTLFYILVGFLSLQIYQKWV